MDTTYDFLELLELDEGAEERDIRRAYARKLKRIDQEADPDAFQALRSAYEVALDWARWKLAQDGADAPPAAADSVVQEAPPAAQEPAPAPEPEPEPEPPEAMRLGGEVFGRLGNSAKELTESGKLGDVEAWRAAIEARFGDEELVNIDARIYFEAFVASMLANGWRQGHEALFVAAKEAFAWDGDRRRLWQLGQAGRLLDQAIEERHVFHAQPGNEQVRMRELAKMLRSEGLPARREILKSMRDAERMLARFPALMAIVTDMGNVERWRAIYREAGGKPIDLDAEDAVTAPAGPQRTFSTWQGVVLFLALSAVLRAVFNHSGGEQDAGRGGIPPTLQQAPGQTTFGPIVPPVRDPRLPKAGGAETLVKEQPVFEAELLAHLPPIRFVPSPDAKQGRYSGKYRVYLDFDGKVNSVTTIQPSGDTRLDRTIHLAFWASKPFPGGFRSFDFSYTTEIIRTPAGLSTTPPETSIED